MKKIFIDTSIFIRFLTKDNLEKYLECESLFKVIKEGKIKPYTSNIVLLEIIFVLTRQYRFPKQDAIGAIKKLLLMRNVTLIEETDSQEALKLFEDHKIKYQDCLIATQVPKGTQLVTYDADFFKIPLLSVVTPKEMIQI